MAAHTESSPPGSNSLSKPLRKVASIPDSNRYLLSGKLACAFVLFALAAWEGGRPFSIHPVGNCRVGSCQDPAFGVWERFGEGGWRPKRANSNLPKPSNPKLQKFKTLNSQLPMKRGCVTTSAAVRSTFAQPRNSPSNWVQGYLN